MSLSRGLLSKPLQKNLAANTGSNQTLGTLQANLRVLAAFETYKFGKKMIRMLDDLQSDRIDAMEEMLYKRKHKTIRKELERQQCYELEKDLKKYYHYNVAYECFIKHEDSLKEICKYHYKFMKYLKLYCKYKGRTPQKAKFDYDPKDYDTFVATDMYRSFMRGVVDPDRDKASRSERRTLGKLFANKSSRNKMTRDQKIKSYAILAYRYYAKAHNLKVKLKHDKYYRALYKLCGASKKEGLSLIFQYLRDEVISKTRKGDDFDDRMLANDDFDGRLTYVEMREFVRMLKGRREKKHFMGNNTPDAQRKYNDVKLQAKMFTGIFDITRDLVAQNRKNAYYRDMYRETGYSRYYTPEKTYSERQASGRRKPTQQMARERKANQQTQKAGKMQGDVLKRIKELFAYEGLTFKTEYLEKFKLREKYIRMKSSSQDTAAQGQKEWQHAMQNIYFNQ